MKFLVIGDTHFKKDNIPESEQLINSILNINDNFDSIILLGDIFDKHETVNTEVLTLATKFLYKLSEKAELFILIGNHDRPNNSSFLTDKHALNPLKYWKNTHVIDTTELHEIKGKNFIFVPYVPPGRFMEAINTIKVEKEITCIFAHQEFYGSSFGSGITSQVGDTWPENFPNIISGHIHTYSQLQKNILYIGTPIQHTYGEKPDKTISIIEFENSQNRFLEQRIDLGLPKKLEYNINANEVLNWIPPENTKCRLIIHGDTASIKSLMLSDHIKNLKSKGVSVLPKINKVTENNNINQPVFHSSSYLESLYNNILKTDEKLVYIYNNLLKN